MNSKSAMSNGQINELLSRSSVGTLATVNADGSPYAVPVHFIVLGDKIYIHCGYHGQKLKNIKQDRRVCLSVWEMFGLYLRDNGESCRTGTQYESVIISGSASVTEDANLKRAVLREFTVKYAPSKDADNIPDEAILKTCVIEIKPTEITGKRK